MDFYSGQGQLSAAKRDVDGSIGPKFRLGNVPDFTIDILSGKLQVLIEEISLETLEIIAGAKVRDSGDELSVELGDGAPYEYELFFNGINTAANNRPLVAHLFRVTFKPAESWQLISDGFASAKVSAEFHCDETRQGKCGVITYRHKEAQSGMRLTDAQVAVAQL